MKQTIRFLFVLLALALCVAGGLRLRSWMVQPPEVEVVEVVQEDLRRVLALTGRVRPEKRNQLVPAVRARLESLTKEEGEEVRAGEVLARFDARQVEADLAQARVALRRDEEELAQLGRDLTRTEALAAEGLLATSELEAAQLARARSQRRVEEGRQGIAELDARRDDYVLRSPLDGYVLERPVDPGQVAGPETVIYELATAADPEVEMEVDERYLGEIVLGQEALVAPLGRRAEPFEAEVSYIGRRIDRLSGAAIVRLAFRGLAPDVPVGLSLDVNLEVQEHREALTVPRSAVAGLGGQARVLVVENGRTQWRDVEVIDWPAPRLVVMSGLEVGESVVLEPWKAPENADVRVSTVEAP